MPPTIVPELELAKHGYKVYPQHGYFAPLPRRPRAAAPRRRPRAPPRARSRKFSKADADAFERWDAWLGSLADVLGPLLTTIPPRSARAGRATSSTRPQLAWKLRGLGVDGTADVTRLFTMSIADLLDEYFESPQMQGVLAVSGVIGTWAGPRSAGTAYVMAHHKIGDVGDGQLGSWGFPDGGMGAVSRALRDAAVANGATRAHRRARRADRRAQRPGARRRCSSRARSCAPTWSSPRRIPQITFLRADRPRASCRPTSSSASSAGGRAAAR